MPSEIKSSLKCLDTEEAFDVWFYRPLGFRIAQVAQRFDVHPNTISLAALAIGLAAAVLFYHPSYGVNLLGLVLWLVSETLDSADGQLARLSGKTSRLGAILDGTADTVRFVFAYFFLALRFAHETGGWWIFAIGVAAGASHRVQSQFSDYFKRMYDSLVRQRRSNVDRAAKMQELYAELKRQPGKRAQKMMLWLYIPYLRDMERLVPSYASLLDLLERRHPEQVPESFLQKYREVNRPLLTYHTLLATNLRSAVMFAAVLLNQVLLFFLFELVVLNVVAVVAILAQARQTRHLLSWFEQQSTEPVHG